MAIEVGEEVAVSTGLRYWLIRGAAATSGWLGFVVNLATALLGHRPSNQEVNYGAAPFVQFLAGPVHALDNLTNITARALRSVFTAIVHVRQRGDQLLGDEARSRYVGDYAVRVRGDQLLGREAVSRYVGDYAVRVRGDQLLGEEARARYVADYENRVRADTLLGEEARTRYLSVLAAEGRADLQALQVWQHANLIVGQEAAARQHAVDAAQLAAERHVEAEVVQPTRATWPVLLGELAGATAAAGTDLPQLRALIDQVPQVAPATLPEAAAAPLDITRVLTRAMTDCTIPNCRNLSKYGRDLQGLGTLLGAAGLLAFLAYAVEDPAGAARNTQDTAVDLIDGVVGATKSLLGV